MHKNAESDENSSVIDIYTRLRNKEISPHQICYKKKGQENIQRYTNYNNELQKTFEEHLNENSKSIEFSDDKNTYSIKGIEYELSVCGEKNGDIKNEYKDKITGHFCKEIPNYGYISKGNNLEKDTWEAGDLCNRIVSYGGDTNDNNSIDGEDKYYHLNTDYSWADKGGKGGCTIYEDKQCQKIKEIVDFPGDPPSSYTQHFKEKYPNENDENEISSDITQDSTRSTRSTRSNSRKKRSNSRKKRSKSRR